MRIIVFIITLLVLTQGFSQNLVNNGSFEQLSSCTLSSWGVDSATGWWTVNSSDILNICSISMNYSVPNNLYGNQFAFDGNGYAFFATYAQPPAVDSREYVQTKLIDTLNFGTKYYVSFRLSFSDNFRYATDGIGAFLSEDTVYGIGAGLIIDSIPQVQVTNGVPIIDSTNWTLIEGSFISTGRESFITIGNFKNDAQVVIQDLGGANIAGGYFIDAVCVSVDSLTCYNFVGINDKKPEQGSFSIYPNPVSNELFIDTDLRIQEIDIIDISGREVESIIFNSYSIDVSDLPNGIYILKVIGVDKILTQKFIKQ